MAEAGSSNLLGNWCRGRESNPDGLWGHGILSPERLPVPPPRHTVDKSVAYLVLRYCPKHAQNAHCHETVLIWPASCSATMAISICSLMRSSPWRSAPHATSSRTSRSRDQIGRLASRAFLHRRIAGTLSRTHGSTARGHGPLPHFEHAGQLLRRGVQVVALWGVLHGDVTPVLCVA